MCPSGALTIVSSSALDLSSIIPLSETSKAAYGLASSLLHPAILNHSIRVYLYASVLAASKNSTYHTSPAKKDLLFTASILHDIGTLASYNGPNRFEVDGADAAVELLVKFNVDEEDKKGVWNAIALHTSNGIVQRMGELCGIVRKAIEIDFGMTGVEEIEELAGSKVQFEARYARKEIEKVLSDAVVEQAVKNPAKAPPASWPGVLYKSHLESSNWQGVNKAF